MEPDTFDAIHATLDCMTEIIERSDLIIMDMKRLAMDMKSQADMEQAVLLAGVITFVGLLVVKVLDSSRLDRRVRVAGTAATVVLIGVLSVTVPDWPPASTRHDAADKAPAARIQLAETRCPEAPLDEER